MYVNIRGAMFLMFIHHCKNRIYVVYTHTLTHTHTRWKDCPPDDAGRRTKIHNPEITSTNDTTTTTKLDATARESSGKRANTQTPDPARPQPITHTAKGPREICQTLLCAREHATTFTVPVVFAQGILSNLLQLLRWQWEASLASFAAFFDSGTQAGIMHFFCELQTF